MAFEFVLTEYGRRGFEFWKEMLGEQMNFKFPEEEGEQIEVMPLWDKSKRGRILVTVTLLGHSSWGGEPTKCFFVNQDGSTET